MSGGTSPCWNDFVGKAGRVYTLHTDSEQHALTLDRAEEQPGGTRTGGSFRLEFRGPYDPLLSQGMYRMTAENFDTYVFLVPVGRDEQGSLYEAIFN